MSSTDLPPRERLGELLIKANLIDDIQLRVALQAQKESGERLGTTLVELGFVEEAVLAAFLSKQADMPCINIANIRVPREISVLIPADLALERHVMPIRRAGDTVYVAMADPFDAETILAVEEQIPGPLSVTPMIAPEVSLQKCLTRHYEPEKLETSERTEELLNIVDELESDTLHSLHEKVDALTNKLDALVGVVGQLQRLLEEQVTSGNPGNPGNPDDE
jgi:type IV pilus assembly protein PilB